MTEMETVVLGLGSNRDSEDLTSMQILSGACRALSGFVNIRSWSGVYRTKAMYYENQNDFLNMVVCAETDLSPHRLLDKIHLVEARFGRDRTLEIRNGPRTLDIDIELFGFCRINDADLVVPHEKFGERAFVLKPLLDIFTECADVKEGGSSYLCGLPYDAAYVEKSLSLLAGQGIEKILDSADFRF